MASRFAAAFCAFRAGAREALGAVLAIEQTVRPALLASIKPRAY
jgi:hypothetical protein